MLRRFFCVFEAHDVHHFSPFSPSLFFTSCLSLLLFSSLCGLPLSLLWSSLLCLVLSSSFFLSFVLSQLLLLGCCCCFCRVAAVAAVLLLGAAGRRRCSCSCCWCCWWVLRVLERLFLVSGRFFLCFCLFSLSCRPLLGSCQVHSARRVACTRAGHHDDG